MWTVLYDVIQHKPGIKLNNVAYTNGRAVASCKPSVIINNCDVIWARWLHLAVDVVYCKYSICKKVSCSFLCSRFELFLCPPLPPPERNSWLRDWYVCWGCFLSPRGARSKAWKQGSMRALFSLMVGSRTVDVEGDATHLALNLCVFGALAASALLSQRHQMMATAFLAVENKRT